MKIKLAPKKKIPLQKKPKIKLKLRSMEKKSPTIGKRYHA